MHLVTVTDFSANRRNWRSPPSSCALAFRPSRSSAPVFMKWQTLLSIRIQSRTRKKTMA